MELHEHERVRPNIAGLLSAAQQSEMKSLLAGSWPPLKPLPVFKYESAECRASIEFDKARGEWLCRKIYLPSNNVQEMRGGLAELARSLPNIPAETFIEAPRTQQQKQELDREATRRLQTILEWKVNSENGALYSDLQNYLSESQQQEIEDILRLTLTARQLQFSSKNVAYVFDALSKAGGRLATLLEIARRNKTQQAADPPTGVELTAPSAILQPLVSNFIPETVEDSAAEQMASVFPEQEEPASVEPATQLGPEATVTEPPGFLDANPLPFLMEHSEKVEPQVSAPAFRPPIRTHKVESASSRFASSTSPRHVLEISGVHIAAFAVLFLFAVISLPIGLTVGRGPIGQWFRDAQQSLFGAHVAPPALPDHPVETASKAPAPPSPVPLADSPYSSETTTPETPDAVALPEEKSPERAQNSESYLKAPPTISYSPPATESETPIHSGAIPGRDGSSEIIARVAPPAATPKPADSFKAKGPAVGAWKNRASRSFAPSMGVSRHRAASPGILVTTPAHGTKPFRVSFPEKPIAASPSFAMTSELSVLVPPESETGAAHSTSRLQAGELVYFVWPHYSRQGDRYGSAETVRVRATVGQLGQVLDIKLLSGSATLFPSARNAVHSWRYRPTLLNKKPIAVQQDITIEFRPPRYLSQVHTQRASHNQPPSFPNK